MTHTHFQKSTPEKIKEMKELYKKGVSFSEISRKLEVDRSTIYWWLKKDFEDVRSPQQQTIIHRKFLKKEREKAQRGKIIAEKEKKELEKITHCHNCGKLKTSPRWKKTHYCSLKCFSEYHKDKDPKVNLNAPIPCNPDDDEKHNEFWNGSG